MLMEELHGSMGRDQLPAGNPGRRRRTGTTVAVTLALALVGAGLALTAGANDDGQGRMKVLADPAPFGDDDRGACDDRVGAGGGTRFSASHDGGGGQAHDDGPPTDRGTRPQPASGDDLHPRGHLAGDSR